MRSPRNRILYVEDHEDTCEMMKFVLEMSNYEVALARTVADGSYLAQSEHFDLYLLDTRLPDGSGFEICQQICEMAGHGPVIFISGDAYEADKLKGLTAGAVAYLTKPIELEDLEVTIKLLIHRARGESASNA
jgi:two-component system response regulator RegX3